MKSLITFTFVIAMSAGACNHKPAYESANVATSRSSDAGSASSTNPAEAAQPQSQPAEQSPPPAAAPARPVEVKTPAFMDTTKGQARDLPNYPGATVQNISYGPIDGRDTLSLALATGDSMDKIADFYDKAVKANKWTVSDKTRDPEFSEWVLAKGSDDEGKVQIKKDPKSNRFFIVIVRVQKIAGNAEQKK
jgi:hypothetical protein